ncbi:MAG: hypothetical protein HRT44_02935 [Bdellovibrionales bacterium]|nr:hypothetical protein [Bdellovibrionales bacterium]NQZ18201.1 hypothetical protein [Bdellovibrionales bacterium]
MPTYSYQAKSFQGKVINGTIDADSEAEARVKIRAKKLIPVKVAAGGFSSAPSKALG